jgi:hypothetical protein
VLSGKINADDPLPDLLNYIEYNYYNLLFNMDNGERMAIPVSRRGNPQ